MQIVSRPVQDAIHLFIRDACSPAILDPLDCPAAAPIHIIGIFGHENVIPRFNRIVTPASSEFATYGSLNTVYTSDPASGRFSNRITVMSIANSTKLALRTSPPFSRYDNFRSLLPSHVKSQLVEIASLPDAQSLNKRQREFQAGRHCAQSALSQLGRSGPIGQNKDRAPIWPPQVVGSITHNDEFACAAVGDSSLLTSIGIDLETIVPTKTMQLLRDDIVTDAEWARLQACDLSPETTFTIVFSAKESFYKCWYPVTQQFFGFKQAEVESIDKHEITIAMTHGNPNYLKSPRRLRIPFLVIEPYVFTAATIPHDAKEAE